MQSLLEEGDKTNVEDFISKYIFKANFFSNNEDVYDNYNDYNKLQKKSNFHIIKLI